MILTLCILLLKKSFDYGFNKDIALGDTNSLKGDVNSDGKVNSLDYMLVRKHILRISTLTSAQQKLADVNGDNNVSTADYIFIKKIILGTAQDVPVTSVTLSKSSVSLKVGESATITATISPSNATNKGVTWTSSNTNVATVNNGVISAIASGSAIITATLSNSKTASCSVTVNGNTKKYTLSFISEITTGFEEKNVLIKGGEVSEQRSVKLHLKRNIHYTISFDYKTVSDTNQFDVDLFPDNLPQITPTATTSIKHYDWDINLNDSIIETDDVWLRFFDDINIGSGSDITISNVTIKKVENKTYNEGDKFGTLPIPVRGGYKFLGWYTSPTGGTQITSNTKVTSNMNLYPHWQRSFDLILLWGQSNMVGSVGRSFEKDDNSSLLKGIDSDIVYFNQSYGRVLVNMPSHVAYEYRYLLGGMSDVSLNYESFGEQLYYKNDELTAEKVADIQSLDASDGTNMIPYFSQEYYNQTGNRFIVVHAARGALRIGDILPEAQTNTYKSMIIKYKKAEEYITKQGFVINNRFYVVYQGESDMQDNSVSQYANTYKKVHDSLVKDLNLSFGAMVYMVRGDLPCDYTNLKIIRDQQKKLVSENNDIIMGTDFLYKEYCEKGNNSLFGVKTSAVDNSIHVNSAALSQVGRNIAKNIWLSGKIK